jgi:hypothetical protein
MTRLEMMQMKVRFGLLRNHRSLREEAVADHYLKLAQVALEMKKVIDMKRRDPRAMVQPLLDMHMKTIGTLHREDLGIELNWDEPELGPIPGF